MIQAASTVAMLDSVSELASAHKHFQERATSAVAQSYFCSFLVHLVQHHYLPALLHTIAAPMAAASLAQPLSSHPL
jgi:hypothetical protein